ncbi:MAG: DNA mismatch repair endonuclease MutL [Gammaproteobacteria bacterium]
MDSLSLSSSIRILPPQLADQIAAGEVIERPASVLKELLENALDAGASRIDVELKLGGMDAIRVTDNGFGICGQELPLAISRHATSKISRLDDLLQLQSLGFRGEALASICSVSQWEIRSCQRGEEAGYAMRYDQPGQVHEINHAAGTSIWVRKLFYNTPARRKFLRAERTEFRHCDEVFRRMALARFDVGFYFKHNARQLQRLPAANDAQARSRRVSQLCGENFLQNSLLIDFPRGDMRLWGWISKPGYSRQQTDLQYFYINGRIIRDRVINHAMRQAYNTCLGPGRHAAYVLHLELDPASVDVNVHPTKHEVRFREARLIHDFLIRSLRESLQTGDAVQSEYAPNGVMELPPGYRGQETREPPYVAHRQEALAETECFFGQIQAVLLNRFVLTQTAGTLYLIDVSRAQALMSVQDWQAACQANQLKQRPLLIPQRIALDAGQRSRYERAQDLLTHLGFDLGQAGPGEIILRAIPIWLAGFDGQRLLQALLDADIDEQQSFAVIRQQLLLQQYDFATVDLRHWLQRVSQRREQLADCWRELTQTDLQDWLRLSSSHA